MFDYLAILVGLVDIVPPSVDYVPRWNFGWWNDLPSNSLLVRVHLLLHSFDPFLGILRIDGFFVGPRFVMGEYYESTFSTIRYGVVESESAEIQRIFCGDYMRDVSFSASIHFVSVRNRSEELGV
jgi:hypothetical protein